MTNPTVWHCMAFQDAEAGIRFLTALGFTERLVVRNNTDHPVIEHAEFTWGDYGGIMFGSAERPTEQASDWERRTGVGSCYIVVATDADVDATYQRAIAAGAVSVQSPLDQDYGGRACMIRDQEGNQYSIGSYAGQ